jgi:WD40 repeat protein
LNLFLIVFLRDIIFIPDRNNIVSVSWDKTIRVWKSYKKNNKKRKNEDNEKKFDTWVFDQMKSALKTNQLTGEKNPFLTDLDISNFNF